MKLPFGYEVRKRVPSNEFKATPLQISSPQYVEGGMTKLQRSFICGQIAQAHGSTVEDNPYNAPFDKRQWREGFFFQRHYDYKVHGNDIVVDRLILWGKS